ncbi:MAG: GerMN domain-containing protein [Streptosporangiaceae bacterium]|nr:GerMN domain-containing protein [Streptosporangiaceae bacterium]MBV9857689.1 GerMN domain-containing protein [Streptosporangiaceae bacterium]
MGEAGRSRPSWRAALAVAGLLVTSVAGCVSMPSGGPVLSYTVTQGAGSQGQHYLQIIPEPPGPGWGPVDIVKGFLAASASFVGQQKVAREYLTPSANSRWKPSWSATVFGGYGPNVAQAPGGTSGQRALVTVSGQAQASLSASGSYAFPSGTQGQPRFTFDLVKYGGQWRIAAPLPSQLLLTSVEFQADYQLRNLYFFDPGGNVLVPDPVYVPLQATPTNLVSGLVKDLIQPPGDWLSAATKSAFPEGTALAGNVTVDGGTASVNLTGSAVLHATKPELQQISAQLLSTLSGSGQGQPLVQYIELSLNGKPWIPPGAPNGDPVQYASGYQPAAGAYSTFYYLDAHGALWSQKGPPADPVKVAAPRAPSLSAIAVSPSGQYLAGLHDGNVYTGPLGGRLTRRASGGYTALSWDTGGGLWAAAPSGVVLLRADGGNPVQVQLLNSNGTQVPGTVTTLRVAPDGVRVALVIDGKWLRFGAISIQGQSHAAALNAVVTLSPFYVSGSGLTSVTWYGADDVIALSAFAPPTEYPVNGGTSVAIPSEPRMVSITASSGNALVAGLANGGMAANPSTAGSWGLIGRGLAPVYPG